MQWLMKVVVMQILKRYNLLGMIIHGAFLNQLLFPQFHPHQALLLVDFRVNYVNRCSRVQMARSSHNDANSALKCMMQPQNKHFFAFLIVNYVFLPITQATVNIHSKILSKTIATYFQSSEN